MLRAMSLVAVVAGAVGSVGFLLNAVERPPRLLMFLFIMWVLSPFVALAWANVVAQRWSAATRATLYSVTLVLTLASLAIYGKVVRVAPPGSPKAFLFVLVPPASWLLMTIVPILALVSRRLTR